MAASHPSQPPLSTRRRKERPRRGEAIKALLTLLLSSSAYSRSFTSTTQDSSISTSTAMAGIAKTLALLCFLSALAVAHSIHFIVQGRVYCDTCRFGFETKASTYIAGAKVRVECKDRETGHLTYSIEGVTDETGTYKIPVEEERPDEICEAILVSSSLSDCQEFEKGRERARILLTKDNGISNPVRFANSLGFIKDKPVPGCSELLKQFELDE